MTALRPPQALTRLLIAALALLIAATAVKAGAVQRHAPPRELPPVSFETRDKDTRTLAALRGKVVVLHVWATWCGTCRTEFPSLLEFQNRFSGRDVVLVTVSIDRLGWPIIERTLSELNAQALPVFLDRSREIPSSLNTFGLPFSVIVNREGREIARILGASDWQSPELVGLVEDALAQ